MNQESSPPPSSSPPPGLLASVGVEQPAKAEQPAPAAAPSIIPVYQDTYIEPVAYAWLESEVAEASVHTHEAVETLLKLLLARVRVLEEVALPVAEHAFKLSHARMGLMAMGQGAEPAGGTWLNVGRNVQCTPNEKMFFDVADVVGRGKVESYIERKFQELEVAAKAAHERDAAGITPQ